MKRERKKGTQRIKMCKQGSERRLKEEWRKRVREARKQGEERRGG